MNQGATPPPHKPRIAVFAGATATVLNSAPLITSNKKRKRNGLPLLEDGWGQTTRFDPLRPQRLAAPATVYVEAGSAHPLEDDAAELYGAPDGYLNEANEFNPERTSPSDRPVYQIVLEPEDGLYPLPYMALQADGRPWDSELTRPGAPDAEARQCFYPDASRVFEEVDRLGWDGQGRGNLLGSQAEFDFYRALPSGGYQQGLATDQRTDIGEGDIPPERRNEDFYAYRPGHLADDPERRLLARLTNRLTRALATGEYLGALWLEGSPAIEETLYWLSLLVDTGTPIVGVPSSDWPHGTLAAAGDRNLVNAVRYLTSRIWAEDDGSDRIGAVLVDAERVFTARDVQKVDARAGGYTATGGHGGVVASLGDPGDPVLTFVPVTLQTRRSQLRISVLPRRVRGVTGAPEAPRRVEVEVKDREGALVEDAVPHVSIFKHARYLSVGSPEGEVELLARIRANLERFPLSGLVVEAYSPYGATAASSDAILSRAAVSGIPVVRVGRGNPEGWVPKERMTLSIAGANLTATKARMLLMACLLRFGALPPARDPLTPTDGEIEAVNRALRDYQVVFDTH